MKELFFIDEHKIDREYKCCIDSMAKFLGYNNEEHADEERWINDWEIVNEIYLLPYNKIINFAYNSCEIYHYQRYKQLKELHFKRHKTDINKAKLVCRVVDGFDLMQQEDYIEEGITND